MTHNIWVYIFVMCITSYLLRVLPLTLIRKQITNRFIKSLLFYMPYATLAVMTFPAILSITENPLVGLASLVAAIAVAWFHGNMFLSAIAASGAALIVSLL